MKKQVSGSKYVSFNGKNGHNYELFELRKILKVSGSSSNQQKASKPEQQQDNVQEDSSVKIKIITSGGFKGHEFIAIYTNNSHLIFRYVGENGVPLIKHLPWFLEPNKSIVCLAFNPTAQWLLCVTADLSLALLPIYFFMCKFSSAHSQKTFTSPPSNPSSNSFVSFPPFLFFLTSHFF